MARTLVQEKWAAPTAASPQTLAFNSSTVLGNQLFYVFAEDDTPPYVTSITDTQSNVWYRIYGTDGTVTQPFMPTRSANRGGISIWTARALQNASCTLTITFSATPTTNGAHGMWEESGWPSSMYPHVQFPITREVFAAADPIDFGTIETDQESMVIAAMFIDSVSAPYNTSATITQSFTVGLNGTRVSISRRLLTVGAIVAPDMTTGASESGDTVMFAILAEPFPSRNLKMRLDASRNRHITSSLSGFEGSGSVVSGDSAERWWSTMYHHSAIPDASVTVFQPYDITWEDDTILTNPSIKCAAGTIELVVGGNVGSTSHIDIVSLGDMTFLLSFLIESTDDLDDNATVYFNSPLWGQPQNNFYGLFLRYTGGELRLYIYNWDGNNDNDYVVIAINTKYVVKVKHSSTSMVMTVYEPGATTGTVTVTTGATSTNAEWQINYSTPDGTRQVRARYGEALGYGDDLAGSEETDATEYMKLKWFDGVLTSTIRCSGVFGEDGDVQSSRTWLFNLDGTARTVSTVAAGSVYIGGRLILHELAAEPDGIANTVTLFAIDDGAGNTVFKGKLGTGSAQTILS